METDKEKSCFTFRRKKKGGGLLHKYKNGYFPGEGRVSDKGKNIRRGKTMAKNLKLVICLLD